MSWQNWYGQQFCLPICLQWPLPREVTPLDEPVECGDASPLRKGCCNAHCKDNVSMNFWSSKACVTMIMSIKRHLQVLLMFRWPQTLCFQSFLISSNEFSNEPKFTNKNFSDFINVTLVCDDDRFKAHKKEKLILLLTVSLLNFLVGHQSVFLTLQWIL